jgi:hypothetical protein
VIGEVQAVQLATSSISAVIDFTTVRGLPLSGRSWTDLATLQPRPQSSAPDGCIKLREPLADRGILQQIIAMFDNETEQFQEWSVPIPWYGAYDVAPVDPEDLPTIVSFHGHRTSTFARYSWYQGVAPSPKFCAANSSSSFRAVQESWQAEDKSGFPFSITSRT